MHRLVSRRFVGFVHDGQATSVEPPAWGIVTSGRGVSAPWPGDQGQRKPRRSAAMRHDGCRMKSVHQRLGVWLAASCLALPVLEAPRQCRCIQVRAGVVEIGSGRLPAAGQAAPDSPLRLVSRSGQASGRACGSIRPRPRSRGERPGRPILPGHGEESPLIPAVRGEGATERMPLNRPPLAAAEISLLQDWIDQGAKAIAGERPGVPPRQSHWAFLPPRRPSVPDVRTAGWARNPIDRFILARLEQAGAAPSPEADRRPCCAGSAST